MVTSSYCAILTLNTSSILTLNTSTILTLYSVYEDMLYDCAEVLQVKAVVSHSLKGRLINQTLHAHSIQGGSCHNKHRLHGTSTSAKPYLPTPSRFFLWMASCSWANFSPLLPLCIPSLSWLYTWAVRRVQLMLTQQFIGRGVADSRIYKCVRYTGIYSQ